MPDDLASDTGTTVMIGAFVVIGLLVACVFAYVIIRGLTQWTRNNASPLETVPATVVTKRTEQGMSSSSTTSGSTMSRSASTFYFATFEMADGSRIELPLRAQDYAMLADGDRGQLTHQGTRFKGFARDGAPTSTL